MLAATLLGIFFIPALFVFVERLTHKKSGNRDSHITLKPPDSPDVDEAPSANAINAAE